MKKPVEKSTILFGIAAALLFLGNLAMVLYYDPQVKRLTSDAESLRNNLTLLREDYGTLQTQKESLNTELASTKDLLTAAQDQVAAKSSEFTTYKGLLKEYVSISKVVQQDVQLIVATNQQWYDEKSPSYSVNKRIVDLYETQLNVMEGHIEEYNTLLRENEASFKEIGIDVRSEINTIESSLPLYRNELENMKEYLATLR